MAARLDHVEIREIALQDREAALWADKEAFGEYADECLTYRPRRWVKPLDPKNDGYWREADLTGLRPIQFAQQWHAAKPEDRDAIALAFGKSLLEGVENYITEKAAQDVEDGEL